MTGDKALGLMLRWLLWCERDDQRLVNSARLPDHVGPLEELLASGRDSDTQHPRVTNSAAADGPTLDAPNAGIKQSALINSSGPVRRSQALSHECRRRGDDSSRWSRVVFLVPSQDCSIAPGLILAERVYERLR